MSLSRDRRLGADDRIHAGREPAEAHAGRRGRRARLCAPVRRGRRRLGRRRAAARLRLRAVSRPGEPSVSRRRGPEGARLSRVGHARDPVARGLFRRAARVAPREDALRLRRNVGHRDRRRARAAVEEHPRPGGLVRHEADEGQGLRPRREPRRPEPRRRGARHPARPAHHERHRLHAGAGGRLSGCGDAPGLPAAAGSGVQATRSFNLSPISLSPPLHSFRERILQFSV